MESEPQPESLPKSKSGLEPQPDPQEPKELDVLQQAELALAPGLSLESAPASAAAAAPAVDLENAKPKHSTEIDTADWWQDLKRSAHFVQDPLDKGGNGGLPVPQVRLDHRPLLLLPAVV